MVFTNSIINGRIKTYMNWLRDDGNRPYAVFWVLKSHFSSPKSSPPCLELISA